MVGFRNTVSFPLGQKCARLASISRGRARPHR